jgi:hypothetical protein
LLGLEISTAAAGKGWVLGFVYIISVLPFEVALFLYYHTVFYLFDIEKEIINASKKRKI